MESFRIDTAQMRPSDALVRMLAAPISSVDLAQVRAALLADRTLRAPVPAALAAP